MSKSVISVIYWDSSAILAAAKTLQTKLPEICMLTIDGLLEVAARGKGLIR